MLGDFSDFEVYVDSPWPSRLRQFFRHNTIECYDDETMDLVRRGIDPISFPGLKTAQTSDESKAINFDTKPKVIISSSGMCEAGRIRHHLKHNLLAAGIYDSLRRLPGRRHLGPCPGGRGKEVKLLARRFSSEPISKCWKGSAVTPTNPV